MNSVKAKSFVVLLDNGHARSTPGKRSPKWEDGTRFYEYEFSRDVVKRISEKLKALNIRYEIITPEVDYDVPLTTRAKRANAFCDKYGKDNCLFISVHANAAGSNDKWLNGRGWSVWTTVGKTQSDTYATIFYKEAEKLLPQYGMTLRKNSANGDYDFESNFTVIYKTKCPAILTENLFQDNKTDCKFLMSDKGRDVIAQIHVNAIKEIINKL
jgi:N-acetylmuramoyl-L-alanine amidase